MKVKNGDFVVQANVFAQSLGSFFITEMSAHFHDLKKKLNDKNY